jgi:hypothetical protein
MGTTEKVIRFLGFIFLLICMGIYKGKLSGKIFSKEEGVGSLSAGPEYYLIPEENYAHWGEIPLRKKSMLWQSDPVLHKFIGKRVEIYAEIIDTKDTITVDYIEVKEIE